MQIGFLGAGKMAQAMARGLLASGTFTRDRIIASAVDDLSANEMRSLGVEVTNNNYEVVEQREIVVVAVKPNVVQTVLQQVSPIVTPENLIVSVAAGVPLGIMEKVSLISF
ncbi:pyrroline-5-carboxylate reductase 3 [Exaiptasia diaphana]|uniref:Pyrroline-5-carboxylate reductase catalytic N-terminal domain-containing protein n=1 Tax=Exaiptasia diaphana TaxID=2652724 RepID=A0A913YQ28_EXADI|nr:pyrroline-5-carboxylate reductase 3 [Exaiptasia diaphana]KXJ25559.1 Pyrroline-5-carboxylate reductase 3 [Exaiptasia diaphana]